MSEAEQPLSDSPETAVPEGAAVEQAAELQNAPSLENIDPKRVIEALLFVGKTPLPLAKLADILEPLSRDEVKRHLLELVGEYEQSPRAFHIVELAGGYQMLTRPDYAPWLMSLYKKRREEKIPPAALETLAIVAYKQPITRADVDSVRGVASDYAIRLLMERGLIRVTGREESLGRPMQYGTTTKFLDHFGLASTKDLPKVEDIEKK